MNGFDAGSCASDPLAGLEIVFPICCTDYEGFVLDNLISVRLMFCYMVVAAPEHVVSPVLAFPDAVGLCAAGLVDPVSVTGLGLVAVHVVLYLRHDNSSCSYVKPADVYILGHWAD